jgi:hypothetical protein
MNEKWQNLAGSGWKNGVDSRIASEVADREWTMALFSSLGQGRIGPDALFERMLERRKILLGRWISSSVLRNRFQTSPASGAHRRSDALVAHADPRRGRPRPMSTATTPRS